MRKIIQAITGGLLKDIGKVIDNGKFEKHIYNVRPD